MGEIWAFGSFNYGMLGAASSAQGDSAITRYTDALSARNNPALMALSGAGGISLEFNRPEGLASLDRLSASVVYSLAPRYGFALGLSAVTSGDSIWRESDYGFSVSYAPFSALALGVTGRVLHINIAEIGTRTLPSIDAAFLFCPLPSLRIAGGTYALTQAKIGIEKGDRIESTFRMACVYEALPGLIFGAGAALDSLGLSPSFSSEYTFHSSLALRSSYRTAESALSLGLGYALASYQFDLTAEIPLRGGELSYGCTLAWAWGERDSFGRLGLSPLNINTAHEKEIASLPGVSARLAERIVRERSERKFYSINDLYRISGFSYTVMKKLADRIAVTDDGMRYVPLIGSDGLEYHINGYTIRDLVARGIRADTARRIVLLRKELRGFASVEDLELLPESNLLPLLCGDPR